MAKGFSAKRLVGREIIVLILSQNTTLVTNIIVSVTLTLASSILPLFLPPDLFINGSSVKTHDTRYFQWCAPLFIQSSTHFGEALSVSMCPDNSVQELRKLGKSFFTFNGTTDKSHQPQIHFTPRGGFVLNLLEIAKSIWCKSITTWRDKEAEVSSPITSY